MSGGQFSTGQKRLSRDTNRVSSGEARAGLRAASIKRDRTMLGVKLIGIGNSVGIIIPDDILARLGVGRGDQLRVVETSSGIELIPCGSSSRAQLDAAEQIMREDRDALKKLAD